MTNSLVRNDCPFHLPAFEQEIECGNRFILVTFSRENTLEVRRIVILRNGC